jgi:hypothetical protein
MKAFIVPGALAIGIFMALSACTSPYAPGQHTTSGGLPGGGSSDSAGAPIRGTLGENGGVATPQSLPPSLPRYEYTPPSARHYAPRRRCGPARHWVHRHYDRLGRWIAGHCAPKKQFARTVVRTLLSKLRS